MTANILVAYYSTYGANLATAQAAAEALEHDGYSVRLRRFAETAPEGVIAGQPAWAETLASQRGVPELAADDVVWAEGIVFAFPTRFGSAPAQVKAFLDTLGGAWGEGKLANKAITAMTSAQNPHGGQESTLLAFYASMMHWNPVLVPPGYADPAVFATGGNPYGFSQTSGAPLTDDERAAIGAQARRVAKTAAALRGVF